MSNKINITPTWKEAIKILITILENGTEEGKREARKGLLEIGDYLDYKIKKEESFNQIINKP